MEPSQQDIPRRSAGSLTWRGGHDRRMGAVGTAGLLPGPGAPGVSPDGATIMFVSAREGHSNVYLMPLRGGEARRLTDISTGVSDPLWSPDGKSIAFASDVYPECGADDACNKKISERWQNGPLHAHAADRLLYRHWTGWKDGPGRTYSSCPSAQAKSRT